MSFIRVRFRARVRVSLKGGRHIREPYVPHRRMGSVLNLQRILFGTRSSKFLDVGVSEFIHEAFDEG